MSEEHRPTSELRYAYVLREAWDHYDGPYKTTVLMLQQKWVSDLVGEAPQWRDVPTVIDGGNVVYLDGPI